MKIILSRKGFDSSAGGVPNPLFADGRLLSLPIPDALSPITYSDIAHQPERLGSLVEQLTKQRILPHHGAHLDPDLRVGALPRLPGWRPMLGQYGAAQSHLRNQGVGAGDVFLFFTVFQPVVCIEGGYQWQRQSRPIHALWGWLQVDEVLDVSHGKPVPYAWAAYHPHCYRHHEANNVIYTARQHLTLGGENRQLPGAGVFPFLRPELQLTAMDSTKPTLWALPFWFYPEADKKPLTYHTNLNRWQREGERTLLQSVYRGQEFVLDAQDYPEALGWVEAILQLGPGSAPKSKGSNRL